MNKQSFDLIVIGAGPGGEVGAIRAAQLGLKVALVEKNIHLGGTCLNVGCIPTKALIESGKVWRKLQHMADFGFDGALPKVNWTRIMARKEEIVNAQRKGLAFLMKKNKVTVFHGHGRFAGKSDLEVTGEDKNKTLLTAKYFLLATGSRVRELPFAKSNGKNILNSDSVLSLAKIPKSLAVIGGGVVGMEFASLFGSFGSEVTVIEMADQILPFEDIECVKELSRHIKKQNVTIKTSAKLTSIKDLGARCEIEVEGEDKMQFEQVLVSIGRQAVTDDLGLEKAGIKPDERGMIKVDGHYKTSVDHIFAVGDIINTPALAHTASAEAKHAVEIIAGHKLPMINYDANPSAIYTHPEIASIGKTEAALKKSGIDYKIAKFPFAPLAKAKIEDATEGFIKILYDPKYRELLGVHIVGAKATELIAEFVLGKVLETTVDEIGLAIHPHPTISETIWETAHVAEGAAIHL